MHPLACSIAPRTFSTAAVRSLPVCRVSPLTFLPSTSNRFLFDKRSNKFGPAAFFSKVGISPLRFFLPPAFTIVAAACGAAWLVVA